MNTHDPTPRKPLRLWPGVVAAVLLVLVGYVIPIFVPEYAGFGMMGAAICALIVILWWVFFSRARWYERVGAIVLMIIAVFAEKYVVHASVAGGAMGMLTYVLAFPSLCVALVVWAAASRRLAAEPRSAAVIVAILLGCVPWMLVRTGGMTASGVLDLHWRWTKTPEERLLAQAGEEPKPLPPAPAVAEMSKPLVASREENPAKAPAAPAAARTEPAAPAATPTRAEWPGFRGPGRDSIIRGVRIETDWSRKPPVELWRRPIGPGWSSFAVRGDLVYTQEQRGEEEVVSGYRLTTGEPVWRHKDAVRFWESNAGAGPRGTPTVHGGRVYTVGATGLVNALEAGNGAVIWSRNAVTDTGKTIPDWGIASSPLVVDDLVIVAVAGQLVAYDAASGKQRWLGETGGGGYSSPHLVTIGGVPQVLLIKGSRTISVSPADGGLLWEHSWLPAVAILQPAVAANGDVLVASHDGMTGIGIRRIAVARKPDGWTVEERWTSRGLKPYFNDFVVHKGHAYGFDGSILSCINLEDGARKWKGGRYGSGQLVLLPDQDVLLVLSEEGELALVSATPDQFKELARFPALNAKTWNHPALVGDVLLVRNGEEMAAFRLSLAGR